MLKKQIIYGFMLVFLIMGIKNTVIAQEDNFQKRIWPSEAPVEYSINSDGESIPTTGENSATWFYFGNCGNWKTFNVPIGSRIKIESHGDSCPDCLLWHINYYLDDYYDGKWHEVTYIDGPDYKGCKHEHIYMPKGDKIRIRATGGFYVAVYEDLLKPFAKFDSDVKGVDLKCIIYSHTNDWLPSFSPDGEMVVYSSDIMGNNDIWVFDMKTSKAMRLTMQEGEDFYPDCSPDGKAIAYDRSIEAEKREIWIMNLDGSNNRKITNFKCQTQMPDFSPDSKKIVFSSNLSGNDDIWVMDIDSSGLKRLTINKKREWQPCWSPDGEKIVYGKSSKKTGFDLWIMDNDGNKQVRLTDFKGDETAPAWSPDGNWIAFASTKKGNSEIWVIAPDGTHLNRITSGKTNNYHPCWSSDSQKIIFHSMKKKQRDIWMVSIEEIKK